LLAKIAVRENMSPFLRPAKRQIPRSLSHPTSMKKTINHVLGGGLVTIALCSPVFAERVLIRSPKPYNKIVKEIERQGGKVTHQYKYIDLIAAEVPDVKLGAVRSQLPEGAVTKDWEINGPKAPTDPRGRKLLAGAAAVSTTRLASGTIQAQAAANPNAYLISLENMNLSPLFAGGHVGQGIKVAVIDTGIRPGFPHISLDGSVIGGEDFVGDSLGFSNAANNGHGTVVAGMISANVAFTFDPMSPFLAAVQNYCPDCVVGAGNDQIPMVGSAPASSIYSLRVFPPTGGSPTSVIIAAMEKVLQLRDNFDHGMPET